METSKNTKRILKKIEISLEKDIPISGMADKDTTVKGISHTSSETCTLKPNEKHIECPPMSDVPLPTGPEEMSPTRGKKTANVVEINTMSLYQRRFTTPGVCMPPPLFIETADYNVQDGDTWENLAVRTSFNLEILLRVNGVSVDKVYDILDKKSTTDDIPLKIGQTIKLPMKMTRGRYY